ncbi:hypothetical protein K488DRAFT_29848, partial [Vararia minispora EC-137]
YPTLEAEAAYWRSAEHDRRKLHGTNANAEASMQTPLPLAYLPRLTPAYRDQQKEDPAALGGDLSVDEYRKWHRMIYPRLPTPSCQAARREIARHSVGDQREMRRISNLLSNADLKAMRFRVDAFVEMWEQWLERKEYDLVIVFE